MKIVSNFIDYYDLIDGNKKSPVYNRTTKHFDDILVIHKEDLRKSKIETNENYLSGDIWMTGYMKNPSSTNFVKIVPVLVGIAGEFHYYVEYHNSVLNIHEICYDYPSLVPYYKNIQTQKTFDLYNHGLLKGYCKQQFGCVNFIMRRDSSLYMIKEPQLDNHIEINRFLTTAQEIYSKIETFLIRTKELDKEYKKLKPSKYEYEKISLYKRRGKIIT